MRQLYKFDSFTIDVDSRLLYKEGKLVALKPKVFDTLLMLVEAKGNLLDKEKLMTGLWSDTAVEENNLTQNISALRKALGKRPDNTNYIETLSKRGYRFCAAVLGPLNDDDAVEIERHQITNIVITQNSEDRNEKLVPAIEEERSKLIPETLTIAPPVVTVKWWQSSRTLLALGLLVLVSIGVVIATGPLFSKPPTQQDDWRLLLQPTPVLSFKKEKDDRIEGGQFNSDAKLIAYTQVKNDKEDVWITTPTGESSQPVTKDEFSNRNPIWIPETGEIAYISQRGEKLGIWKTNLFGVAPTLIKSFDEGEPGPSPRLLPTLRKCIHQTIYYEWRGNFYALSLGTREVKNLTNFDSSRSVARGFDVSADEKWLCYTDRVNGQWDIWKRPLGDGESIVVTNDPAEEKFPLWYPDGQRILYKAIQSGKNQICSIDVDTRAKTQITFEKDEGTLADISSDGTKFLYAGRADESDLRKVDVSGGKEEKITDELGVEFWPTVSPDSKTVAFQKIKGLQINWNPIESELYTREPAVSNSQRSLASGACRPQWAPDGKVMTFIRSDKGVQNLWLFDPASGEQHALTTTGVSAPASIVFPFNTAEVCDYSWSPDSSRIVYRSREDLIPNITIISRDGANKTQITDNTDPEMRFVSPIWSPDGKKVAYVTEDILKAASPGYKPVWKLWVYDEQASKQWLELPQTVKLLGWLNSGEVLIATMDNAPGNQHNAVDIALTAVSAGGTRELARLEKTYANNIHLSSDGKTVAFVSTQDGNYNLYTLSISSKALKKLTENREPQVFFSSLAWSPDGTFIVYGRQSREYLLTLMNNLK